VYRSIKDFADGNAHDVEFEVNIPITNFLGFQCFDKWLSREGQDGFGKLTFQIYFSHTKPSMAWACVNPMDVLENKQFLQTDFILTPTLAGDVYKFKHSFTQNMDAGQGFTDVITTGIPAAGQTPAVLGTSTFSVGEIRVNVHESTAIEIQSTIRGFNISDASKASIIRKIYAEKTIIPAQDFPTGPSDGGLSCNIQMNYINVCCVAVVFPKTDNQITVLGDVQLKIGSDFIPKKKFATTSPRYPQEQPLIADLEDGQAPTDELADTIASGKNADNGTRYINCLRDDTSLITLFQTERSDGGLAFDGLSGSSLNTELTAPALHRGIHNTYYYPRMLADGITVDMTQHPPAPQLWCCQDTFFVLAQAKDGTGLKLSYFNDRSPDGSQSGDRLY
jgi:hypothetical protein